MTSVKNFLVFSIFFTIQWPYPEKNESDQKMEVILIDITISAVWYHDLS